MNPTSVLAVPVAVAALMLAAPATMRADDPAAPAPPAPRFVVVTNIVIVTNCILTTNVVIDPAGVPAAAPRSNVPDLGWVPPTDAFDWVQLKSGEWLKGRIKAMQDRKLEFESEELDLLTFDWPDIRQLRSPRVNDLLFQTSDTRERASGPVVVTPQFVTVGDAEPRTFPREQLTSIAPGGTKEANHWSGRIVAGLTLRAGNTKSTEYNAQMNLQRRTPESRLRFDYLGNFSTVNGVESANNHRVNAEFDYWVSRRLYAILPAAEYFRDRFQNIGHRLTLGAGVGWDLVSQPGLEWNVSTGPAFQHTWFDSVQSGESTGRGAAALTFGSRFDWTITRRIDLLVEYRGQFTKREIGETFHHAEATFEIELTRLLDLDISFFWDRIQVPKQQSDGTLPKQDDFRLVMGLGVKF